MRSLIRPTLVPIALVFMLGAASLASAAEAPLRLDDLRDAIDGRRTELGTPVDRQARRVVKGLGKALAAIESEKARQSRRNELKAAQRAAQQLERRARDETALFGVLDQTLEEYDGLLRAEVRALQALLESETDAGTASRKMFKRTRRATKKLERSRAEGRRGKRLKLLVAVDRALSAFPDLVVDSGGGGGGGGNGGGNGGGGGGPDPDPGRTLTWVIDTLAISAAGTGFDLDGDGTIDNSLARMQGLVGPLNGGAPIDGFIAQNITTGARLTVLQMWAVHSLTNDSDVSLGMLEPSDQDGDATDNLNGSEEFLAAAGSLDGDGHAVNGATAALTSGAYVTTLSRSLTNPVITTGIGLDTQIRIRGVVSENANNGTLAVIFPATDVTLLVGAMLPPINAHLGPGIVASLLDVDTTGNGIPDSMSAAFDFTSVPCSIR